MTAPARRATVALRTVNDVPDKLYFKIGEVVPLVGVEAHVLRYWEREISAIRPNKTRSNQRRYRRRDVELFLEVRRLMYEEKYTLAGVKRRMARRCRDEAGLAEGTDPAVQTDGAALEAPPTSASQRERLRLALQALHDLACAGLNPE